MLIKMVQQFIQKRSKKNDSSYFHNVGKATKRTLGWGFGTIEGVDKAKKRFPDAP